MTDDAVKTKLFGIPLEAKGVNGIAMSIMALAIGGCMFLLYDRSKQNEVQLNAVSQAHAIARDKQTTQMAMEHTAIVDALRSLKEVNESISVGLNEQNYIILSDEQEKREIKKGLRRPPSLSRKLER